MNSLTVKFITKAFIIPIIITAVVIGITFSFANSAIAKSNAVTATEVEDVDISTFSLKEYTKFNQLEKYDYVATVNCDKVGIKCPVVFDCDNDATAADMLSYSTEPWGKNGHVAIVGSNFDTQFKKLHNAVVGDGVVAKFYGRDEYNYQITSVSYNNTKNDLKSISAKNDLILCVPYNNFSDVDGSSLYIVYTAKLV